MEIKLPDNHKRTLSSSLLLVEKSLTELNELMLKHNDICCSEVVSDADNDITDAKRAKIREILKDTLSGKIKGYGTFPKKYVSEYDSDIGKLIEIINRINY